MVVDEWKEILIFVLEEENEIQWWKDLRSKMQQKSVQSFHVDSENYHEKAMSY